MLLSFFKIVFVLLCFKMSWYGTVEATGSLRLTMFSLFVREQFDCQQDFLMIIPGMER